MGTLTADCPRLDTHCDHKLATSCRLTSTPHCCACADERPHSRTYRVYIDGVGFVQRGTRWQGYCERATWARFSRKDANYYQAGSAKVCKLSSCYGAARHVQLETDPHRQSFGRIDLPPPILPSKHLKRAYPTSQTRHPSLNDGSNSTRAIES
jgi:hypothetical protein